MSTTEGVPATDAVAHEPADWARSLARGGAAADSALQKLHAILLRAAHAEARRRVAVLGWAGPEVDDLIHQATDDAVVKILAKLHTFRGDSRFTTWAYKFVVFEVGAKINRHRWHRERLVGDDRWGRLPERLGLNPDQQAQTHELFHAVRRAVEHLPARQRDVFLAIVVHGVPLDVLTEQLDTNRNAIYQALFNARRSLRDALTADGLVAFDRRTTR